MNDHDPRVDRYLHEQAAALDITPAPVARVAHRARQRRNRRRSVAALAVLSLGVVGVDQLTRGDAPDTLVAGSSGEVGRGDALSWRRQDPAGPDRALGYAAGVVRDASGAVYALSTEPGRVVDRAARQAVYRSLDGIDWQATSVLTAGLYLSDLDAGADGRLYALGTSAASASIDEAIFVGVSADAGTTWDRLGLPIDVAAVRAASASLNVPGTSVANGPAGTVAVVTLQAQLDPGALDLDAPHGIRATVDGIDILGPATAIDMASDITCVGGTVRLLTDDERADLADADGEKARADGAAPPTVPPAARRAGGSGSVDTPYGCVIPDSPVFPVDASTVHGGPASSVSWAELEVSDDVRLAALGTPRVFTSVDGATFTEVTMADGTVSGPGQAEVVATPDGFALVSAAWDGAGRPTGSATATSIDGVTWVAGGSPTTGSWWTTVGRLGDDLAVVADRNGRGSSSPVLSTTADGLTWRDVDLSAAVDPALDVSGPFTAGQASFGPAGVAVLLWAVDGDGANVLLTSPDGVTWSTTRADELPGAPEEGSWVRSVAVTDTEVVVSLDVAVSGAPMGTAVFAAPLT